MSLRTGLFWFWGAILVGGAAGAAGLQMMGPPDSATGSNAAVQPAADPKEASAAGMDLQFSPAPAQPAAQASATPAQPEQPALAKLPPLAKAPPVPQPAESRAVRSETAARVTTHRSAHSTRHSVAAAKRPAHRSVTVVRRGTTTTTVTETQPVYGAPPRSYVYAPYPHRWAPYAQAYYPAYPYYPYYAPYDIGD